MNIGWLSPVGQFDRFDPNEDLEGVLAALWDYCGVSVARSRGLHDCEFCDSGGCHHVERKGEELLIGDAEVRIFAPSGVIFAAPTLIYHYVLVHRYKPPADFLHALTTQPRPPSEAYLDKLRQLDFEWFVSRTGEWHITPFLPTR